MSNGADWRHGQSQAQQSRGIAFAILTALLFSCSDALIKQVVAAAPFMLVLCLRYLFQLGVMGVWLFYGPRQNRAAIGSWRLQLMRCSLLSGSSIAGYIALRHMPLAEYTALMMLAPVASVLLGRLILKEAVSPLQWAYVGLGVIGMLAVVQPGLSGWTAQAWLAVLSACCYAAFQMATRKLMVRADIVVSNLVAAVFIAGVSGACLLLWPVNWREIGAISQPSWWLLFLLMCITATGGQVSLAAALQKASLSVAAPFAYLQIVFAAAIGLIFFGHWPDLTSQVGTCLIAAAGIGSAWLNGRTRPEYAATDPLAVANASSPFSKPKRP